MTDEARKARNAYAREYRQRNLKQIREYQRQWRADNKDKVKVNNDRYWERKSLETVSI